MSPDEARRRALAAIDAAADTLIGVSRRMHAEVELSFAEHKAQGWLCAAAEAAPA
ncbi:hypothetical protein [Mangrovicoccus ximenensis]|uniref:hypothetical protein n=1 Tax=Mangrovicoccus ximenensis TaxID=1911570 RepID=UPI0013751D2D|nr:hypothetical protein [Mangrovicoccus ximenensis]